MPPPTDPGIAIELALGDGEGCYSYGSVSHSPVQTLNIFVNHQAGFTIHHPVGDLLVDLSAPQQAKVDRADIEPLTAAAVAPPHHSRALSHLAGASLVMLLATAWGVCFALIKGWGGDNLKTAGPLIVASLASVATVVITFIATQRR